VSEPYIAQVCIFGFNFAPRNYAFCNGALVPISQNEALFSLIGTTYGGNGVSTFALPNIQDRGVLNWGTGPGLSTYVLGEPSGTSMVTLTSGQMSQHNHTLYGTAGSPEKATAGNGDWLGEKSVPLKDLFTAAAADTTLASAFLQTAGGSTPHENEQPSTGLNFCIALYGIYPSRN
jgi:microcystin-dependent protein